MSKIYLAGPISNLTYEEAGEWRWKCEDVLAGKFDILNPLLRTDINHVNKNTGTFGNGHELKKLTSDMFFARDMFWVREADIALANFTLVPPVLGGGTPYELGAAFALNKLVIVVGPKENIPLFCLKGASIYFETLDEAIGFLETL